jgi:hypothetical protein
MLEWIWLLYIKTYMRRVLAIFCAAISITITWSELVFTSSTDLSILSLLLNKPKELSFLLQVTQTHGTN